MKKGLISLAALCAVFVLPSFAHADGNTGQIIVITQSAYGTSVYSNTVTVNASGPSLSTTPSSNSTLSFSANFNGDSRTITAYPGSYSIVSPSTSGQYVSYSSDCSGYLGVGQTRICTITQNNNYQNGGTNARVNVSLTVNNTYGYNRSPSDFTVTVSGNNPSISTFQGTAGTVQVLVNNGYYSVDIQNPGSYTINRSSDCYGTINSGDTRTCQLTLNQNGYYDNNNYYNNNGTVYYVSGTQCYSGVNYPLGSVCYTGVGNYYNNYPVNGTLTCTPATQTVLNGQTASFTAYGSTGPFTWTVDGRSFFAIGPQLNTVLSGPGTHTIAVSNGWKTASCTATVSNQQYVLGSVLGTTTSIPGLPNTGYEPSEVGFALALLGALVAFPLALLMAYPYAKKAARTITR